MPTIDYYQIGERIVASLPELTDAFHACLDRWSPELPGAVNVIDEVFTPALDRWLDRAEDELLHRAFDLIEDLASDANVDIRDAVQVGVVNWIAQDVHWLQRAKQFMGPATLNLLAKSALDSTDGR
jgi:hypothetical protein